MKNCVVGKSVSAKDCNACKKCDQPSAVGSGNHSAQFLEALKKVVSELHIISKDSMSKRPAQAIGCACVYDFTKRALAIINKLESTMP